MGDEVEAKGAAPGGGRDWYRAEVVALRSGRPCRLRRGTARDARAVHRMVQQLAAVSYTHLTLPTKA